MRKVIGIRSGLLHETKHIENLIGQLLSICGVLRVTPHLEISAEMGPSSQRHVLDDRQIAKDLRDLKRSGQSGGDKPMRRPCGHIRSAQKHFPPAGRRNPEIQLNTVVLPAPFGPISECTWPFRISRLTPSTARRAPKFFDRSRTTSGLATATSKHWRQLPPDRKEIPKQQ